MNMNKALQNLYHAVSGSTTTKRNISKLLLDIHYAITGKQSANKNNWSRIIDSMATNWPSGGGGGGDSDFSTAVLTIEGEGEVSACFAVSLPAANPPIECTAPVPYYGTDKLILYKGTAFVGITSGTVASISGDIQEAIPNVMYFVTGDCTITFA